MVHPCKITGFTLLLKMLNFVTKSVAMSITMHDAKNIKFAIAPEAKQIYQYMNIKRSCTKLMQQYGITNLPYKNCMYQLCFETCR
jgi:hypothetical protein